MNLKVSVRLTALAAVMLMVTGLSVTSFSQQSRPRYNQRTYGGGGWTLPPDTIISMRMDQTLSSKSSRVGDRFTASVTEPVQANGRVVIPAGTIVEGRVTQVTPAKRMSKAGMIAIDFDSITMPDGRRVPLVGSLTSDDPEIRRRIDDENSVRGPNSDRKAVFVGGGGTLGAVLGGIAGGGKGAVIGGIAGAGVGIAGVLLSKGEEAEVRAGTPFGIQLRQPLSMRGDPNYDNSPGGYSSRDNNSRDNNSRAGETRPRPNRDPGPDYDRPGRRDSEPRNYPDRRPQPEPEESDPDDVPVEPAREPARDPEPVRRTESTANPEPAASDPEPEPVAVNLPLSSAEMIRRAQVAMRHQGYYEGPLDGVMTPRTSNSLKTYQRENNLPQTGDLDPTTADKLGITKATPANARRETRPPQSQPRPSGSAGASDPATDDRVVLANVLSATANRVADGSLYILINTQANTGGWRWFGEPVANGDTLEVYARAVKPDGMVTQALTRGRIELNVKEGVDLVRRVVVHGAAGNITIPLGSTTRPSESSSSRASEPQSSPVSNIQRQAEQLLSDYKRQIGVRSSGSRTEIDSRYGEPEIELLLALESFANAARHYNNLIPGIQDRQSARSATLSLAREARKTDRVITTTSSSLADSVNRGWDGIRLEVLKLIKAHNISSSDLDD
ncbi:MAG TPA: peptidoglycan-binding protein [Blastocatellia bacterium]|nr:peptidoglycan-binding protein [Blastocatellia bacterium]